MITLSSELVQNIPEIAYTIIEPNDIDITIINALFKKYTETIVLKNQSFEEYLLKEVFENEKNYSYQIIYIVAFFSFFRGNTDIFSYIIKKNYVLNYPPIYILEALEQLMFYNNATKALDLLNKALDSIEPKEPVIISKNADFVHRMHIEIKCLHSFACYLLNDIEHFNTDFDLASKELAKTNFNTEIFYFCYYLRGEAISKRDPTKALIFVDEALHIAQRKQHRYFIGLALHLKGTCYFYRGEFIVAYHHFLKAKENFEEVKAKPFLALLQANLGELEKNVGRYVKAIEYFKETIVQGELLHAPKIEFAGIKGIADLYLAQFNLNLALERYKKAFEKCKDLHDYVLTSYIAHQIGAIQITLEPEKAHQTLLYALSLKEKYNINKIKSLIEVGQLFIIQKDVAKAKTILHILRNQPAVSGVGFEIDLYRVQIFIQENDFENARKVLESLNNIHQGLEFHVQLRILLFLFQLEVAIYKDQNDQSILEEADNWLKELRKLALRPSYPVINTLYYLIESIWIFIYDPRKTNPVIQNLHIASRTAQSYDLIYLQELVEKYLRQFNRTKVKISFSELNNLLLMFIRATILILITI